jgi:hypothetical protein
MIKRGRRRPKTVTVNCDADNLMLRFWWHMTDKTSDSGGWCA